MPKFFKLLLSGVVAVFLAFAIYLNPYYFQVFVPIQRCVPLKDVKEFMESKLPVNPCTFKPLSTETMESIDAVVLTAHPDDESIGMLGWVIDHLRNKKKVVVELMTDGRVSSAQGTLEKEGYPLSDEAFGEARIREFLSSMRTIHATGVRYNAKPAQHLEPADVTPTIDFWMSTSKKTLEFNATAGIDFDSSPHPDHNAVFLALHDYNLPENQKNWSLIYAFRVADRDSRWPAPQIFRLSPITCRIKKMALLQFKKTSPEEGFYNIGWGHSTGDLFRGSYTCSEYRVIPGQPAFHW